MWGLPQKQNARRADKIRLCGHLRRYKKIVKKTYIIYITKNNWPFPSLCTTSNLASWPNRPSQSRIVPTVPMLSVTGHPRGCAWCGGSPWEWPPVPGRRCGARFRLLSYDNSLCNWILAKVVSALPGRLCESTGRGRPCGDEMYPDTAWSLSGIFNG